MNKLNIKEFDQKVASAFLSSFIEDKGNKILLLNEPINFITKQSYKGVQRVLLPLGTYATFNQIKKAGGKVKKGAKAVQLTFIKEIKRTSKKAFKGAKLDKKTGLYTAVSVEPRSYNLFKSEDLEDFQAIATIKSDGAKRYEFNKLMESANKFNQETNKDLKDLSMYIASCMAANLAFVAPVVLSGKDFKHFEKLIKSDASIVRRAFDIAESVIDRAVEVCTFKIVSDQQLETEVNNICNSLTLDQLLEAYDKAIAETDSKKAEAKTAAKKAGQKGRAKKSEVETIKSCASIPSAPKSPKAGALGYGLNDGWGLGLYNCSMDFSKIGA